MLDGIILVSDLKFKCHWTNSKFHVKWFTEKSTVPRKMLTFI